MDSSNKLAAKSVSLNKFQISDFKYEFHQTI